MVISEHPNYGLLRIISVFFLPPFYIFPILHNNHELPLQSEKGFLFLKEIVTSKLDVYKCNIVNLIYFNLVALSI